MKETLSKIDLTEHKGVQVALRQQGQVAGIDLCIQIIFDIVNFEEENDATGRAFLSGNPAI